MFGVEVDVEVEVATMPAILFTGRPTIDDG